jgi:hypothetical protein
MEWTSVLWAAGEGNDAMTKAEQKKALRCAIYTRVSTDAGLEQDFNSLDAQREASEAYVKSQAHDGWKLIRTAYDDGGFSGGSLERPALRKLLEDGGRCGDTCGRCSCDDEKYNGGAGLGARRSTNGDSHHGDASDRCRGSPDD